jgi:hypothetical protein
LPVVDEATVGRIIRAESGRSVAALIRFFGDIDVAEDAVQEAFASALRRPEPPVAPQVTGGVSRLGGQAGTRTTLSSQIAWSPVWSPSSKLSAARSVVTLAVNSYEKCRIVVVSSMRRPSAAV